MGCLLVFFFVAYGSSAALSKVRNPGDESLSIKTRMNEAYDPSGLRVGDINFFPSITNSLRYMDNVYATDIGKVHDFVYAVKPSLDIKSDFIRHEVSASFSAERGLYHDISSENYTDYSAKLGGRFDISGQTSVPLNFSYDRAHYRRGSPDDRASLEPTVYDLWQASAGIVHQGHTLAMKMIADAKRYIFEDNTSIFGRLDNSDRDRDELSLYTSIGMAEEAVFAPFVYTNVRNISYDRNSDRDGYDRDSDEFEIGAGTLVNLSEITKASFHLGYLNRSFADSRFSDVGDLTYGFNLSWEPSPLVMFLLKGDRTVEEAIIFGASASVDTNVNLTMDYELFPNVFLYPTVGYQEKDYQDIDKTITAYNAGLDGTYKMNQNLWLSLSYRYITQDDKGADTTGVDEYDSNTYGLSFKMQF